MQKICTSWILAALLALVVCVVRVKAASEQANLDSERGEEKVVPPPTGARYPHLLHGNDVIHFVNAMKQFVRVGGGSYADVYLGEVRDTGSRVVIKSFRDSDFSEIMKEVRIHRYVQQKIRTPRLLGLLPAGPLAHNISLVYEYVPKSKTLSRWLDKKRPFTHAQWIHVCLQIARNLQALHEGHVLHNDLHWGNIIIQRLRPTHGDSAFSCCDTLPPTVFILDFGSATYKCSRSFKGTSGSLRLYRYLAPELRRDESNSTQTISTSSTKPVTKHLHRSDANKTVDLKDTQQQPRREEKNTDITTDKNDNPDVGDYDLKLYEAMQQKNTIKWSAEYTNNSLSSSKLQNCTFRNTTDRNETTFSRSATSIATDIFALGYALEGVANSTGLVSLKLLSLWCQAFDPARRPSLPLLIGRLEKLLVELALIDLSGSGRGSYHDERCAKHCGDFDEYGCFPFGPLLQRKGKPNTFSTAKTSTTLLSRFSDGFEFSLKNHQSLHQDRTVFEEELRSRKDQLYKDCPVSLALIDPNDLQPPWGTNWSDPALWLADSTHDAIRLAELKPEGKLVIVKEFYDTDFEVARSETCWTHYLAQMGIAPKVIGMLIEYKDMNGTAFVQERFGQGVTLAKFVYRTLAVQWNTTAVERAILGEIEENMSFVDEHLRHTCSVRDFFQILIGTHLYKTQCPQKSPRQLTLECVAKEVAQMLRSVHRSGLLVNNLRSENILLAKEGDTIQVKLVDLSSVTSLEEGLELSGTPEELSRFQHLAPEIVQGEASSVSSDVYSLCVIMFNALKSYFPKYNRPYKKYTHCCRSEAKMAKKSTVFKRTPIPCCKSLGNSNNSLRTELHKILTFVLKTESAQLNDTYLCARKKRRKCMKCSSRKGRRYGVISGKTPEPGVQGKRQTRDTHRDLDQETRKTILLQDQLLKCLYGKPWQRPTIEDMIENM